MGTTRGTPVPLSALGRLQRLFAVCVVALLAFGVVAALPQGANAASYSCSCVLYVRSQTGLPGGPATAAGYTESFMNSVGYRRVLPQQGAILVWDAWQKGSYGDGHMAIINGARYDNSTKKWIVSVSHVNWGGNCGPLMTTFTWGNLYGVNAYVRR